MLRTAVTCLAPSRKLVGDVLGPEGIAREEDRLGEIARLGGNMGGRQGSSWLGVGPDSR